MGGGNRYIYSAIDRNALLHICSAAAPANGRPCRGVAWPSSHLKPYAPTTWHSLWRSAVNRLTVHTSDSNFFHNCRLVGLKVFHSIGDDLTQHPSNKNAGHTTTQKTR